MSSKLGALLVGFLGGNTLERLASDLEPTSPDTAALIRLEGPGVVAKIAEAFDEADAEKKRRFRVGRISDMATQLAGTGLLGAPGRDVTPLAERAVELATAILAQVEKQEAAKPAEPEPPPAPEAQP